MTSDQFRSVLRRKPFLPFEIHTASGETYVVSHPEVAWQSPGGQTVIVGIKGEEVAIFDLALISEIILPVKQPAREAR